MCGRFVAATPPTMLAEHFKVESIRADDLGENYNVAPTNRVYAVAEHEHERALGTFRWGLVPSWAKDPSVGSKMINARGETIATKNAFRKAFQRKRCIIPADGFYEWQVIPGKKAKQPVWIHRVDGQSLAFAGLWELWRPRASASTESADSAGPANGGAQPDPVEPLRTCTIITTSANDRLRPVHDRMPVILPESAWDLWLDSTLGTDPDDLQALQALLVPAANDIVTFHPVSTAVNSVRNRGPELIRPFDPETGELMLM